MLIQCKLEDWIHDSAFDSQVYHGVKDKRHPFSLHDITFCERIAKGANTNETFTNDSHNFYCHGIIVVKHKCPILQNGLPNRYRSLLSSIANFANNHGYSGHVGLHETKNPTNYRVPEEFDVTATPKRKIGDVIL